MSKEDKELLLKDLCARLPFMPKIRITYQQQGIRGTDEGRVSCDFIEKIVNDLRNGVIIDMQIYLRPMSSMTEEEIHEFQEILGPGIEVGYGFVDILDSSVHTFSFLELQALFDWLNKKMFDYRGLIEKNLALDCTGLHVYD